METIKIFIASSSELAEDRKEFRQFLSIENDLLIKKGAYLELVQWENSVDAMSESDLQEEYNKAIKECQIIICLFYSVAGKYTQEEFDTALTHFKETGRPLIYTYFKGGAPEPDPNDQMQMDLIKFKKRLEDLGHFYTSYSNIDDLKLQFKRQIERLEDKGFIKLRNEVNELAKEAIANYFSIYAEGDVHVGDNIGGDKVEGDKITITDSKAVNTGNVDTQGGDVHIGDDNKNVSEVTGDNNTVIQASSGANITIHYNVLPANLKKIKDETDTNDVPGWIENLKIELKKVPGVSVSEQTDKNQIIQYFDWLTSIYLRKMLSKPGRVKNLRRLSLMTEAWQASLRFLCYIQVAQILQMPSKPKLSQVTDFINMEGEDYLKFDYLELLINSTSQLKGDGFVPEIKKFVEDLIDEDSTLYATKEFLNEQRTLMLKHEIKEDAVIPVLEDYLTALVYWLRKVSFLAKYRMASIKEISVDYRLGTPKHYEHLYGEIHSFFGSGGSKELKNTSILVENAFTYSKSVLLFKGSSVDQSLGQIHDHGNYLNLSPLIIDQSVYSDEAKQTPEIYYYTGFDKPRRCYNYALYQNEIVLDEKKQSSTNKMLEVNEEFNEHAKLDELFEQLKSIFKPFKD